MMFLRSPDCIIEQTNKEKGTALHIAAREGHLAVVKALISSKANVNAGDEHGCKPIMHAASKGGLQQVAVLEALIKAGSEGKLRKFDNGRSAMVTADEKTKMYISGREALQLLQKTFK